MIKKVLALLTSICLALIFTIIPPIHSSAQENAVITNPVASNFTKTGFNVSCNAKSPNYIEKVLFPTWTTEGGQDDLVWYEGYYRDGRWMCDVNINKHKKSLGEYVTHIYAYDAKGNCYSVAMNPYTISSNLGYLSNNLPDVRYTPVDFANWFGKDVSEFRGMPGFTEFATSSVSGVFRYSPETPLWWIMEIKYDNNKIYHISLHFYAKDYLSSFGPNMQVWGMYSGMPGDQAIALLSQHGYDCFYVQPDYWQWKDDGRYTVDVSWDEFGRLDQITLNPSMRR